MAEEAAAMDLMKDLRACTRDQRDHNRKRVPNIEERGTQTKEDNRDQSQGSKENHTE